MVLKAEQGVFSRFEATFKGFIGVPQYFGLEIIENAFFLWMSRKKRSHE